MTSVKVYESELAMADGATELDMVVNIGKVLSGEWNYVAHDIAAVVEVAHKNGAKVKVIFENAFLKDAHKIELCKICGEVRADWVKTSTGYAETGATIEDLKLMRQHSPAYVQVKAAGGVRTYEKLLEVRAIGVGRGDKPFEIDRHVDQSNAWRARRRFRQDKGNGIGECG